MTPSDNVQSFGGLRPNESHLLRNWRFAARLVGVDGVEDLRSRPWPSPLGCTVIGVFRSGAGAASWMVIGHDDAWAVVYCMERKVSPRFHSLAEALAAIYPGGVSLADIS